MVTHKVIVVLSMQEKSNTEHIKMYMKVTEFQVFFGTVFLISNGIPPLNKGMYTHHTEVSWLLLEQSTTCLGSSLKDQSFGLHERKHSKSVSGQTCKVDCGLSWNPLGTE